MTEDSTFKFSSEGLTLITKGQDRIENDIREIRKDIKDLRGEVAMKSDMYKTFGLMVLAATTAAAAAVFILRDGVGL